MERQIPCNFSICVLNFKRRIRKSKFHDGGFPKGHFECKKSMQKGWIPSFCIKMEKGRYLPFRLTLLILTFNLIGSNFLVGSFWTLFLFQFTNGWRNIHFSKVNIEQVFKLNFAKRGLPQCDSCFIF